MIRPLAVALALLAAPAAAHDVLELPLRYDPDIVWLKAAQPTPPGGGRIRLVHHGRQGSAALSVDAFYRYDLAYKRHLTQLSYRMPVRAAEPRARHAAFHEVLRAYPAGQLGAHVAIKLDDDPRVIALGR